MKRRILNKGRNQEQKKEIEARWTFLGTVIAALITGIVALIVANKIPFGKSTPLVDSISTTSTKQQSPRYSFEENILQGIGIYSGDWRIEDDGTGNHVFQNEISNAGEWPGFSIGQSITNGIIEYRVKYLDYDLSQDTGSGRVNLFFRSKTTKEGYLFTLHPYNNSAELVYVVNGIWSSPINGSTSTVFFKTNVWYKFRLEFEGQSIKIYLDEILLSEVNDKRFHTGEVNLAVGPGTKVQFDDVSIVDRTP